MSWLVTILLILGGLLCIGPIMYVFSKLNGVDPYVLYKDDDEKDEKSLMVVTVFYPLFAVLWLETEVIKKLFHH